ncbi:AN1-type zinc finger protein 2A [Hypsizygus marmoreus]|uniref:AN1-type zinc finger protein 2A n=1 Tax=Hypsizygus marmoreus TaxID=39966 RepID=A0A369J9H1_HYPMA|nr:AN1-type zinc finger protein 2A [Hypsizygus marmoreus]
MDSPNNNSQLLNIGKQCSHPSCLLIDFLPFKCQHCEDSFCQEHFMVTAHKCPKYDETKHNRVAPDCPLCNTPVAVRPGQDPNARMEEHFNKECSVMTGKSERTRSMPVCARRNCKKLLFSPIRCDKCKAQFCPSHRFPSDHDCKPIDLPPTAKAARSNLLAGVNTKALNAKASAAGAATIDAFKKTVASTTNSAAPPKPAPAPKPPSQKPATPSTHSNPFSKTDRRAKAEKESRRKAMQARAKKGLLTEEEKAILAAEEQEGDKKGDCLVM